MAGMIGRGEVSCIYIVYIAALTVEAKPGSSGYRPGA